MNQKKKIIDMGKKLISSQMVVGTWGNISIKENDTITITPSGVDYDGIIPEHLPVLNMKGEQITGTGLLKPSSELPLHLAIYQAREDVKAIIHTHSIYGTCCAVLHETIPPLVEDMAMVIGGAVAVAKYHLPGTKELAKAVVSSLADKNAVLLANHGVVGVGANLDEAFKACILTEKAAQIYLTAKSIGNPHILAQKDVQLMSQIYRTSYGQKGGKNSENSN